MPGDDSDYGVAAPRSPGKLLEDYKYHLINKRTPIEGEYLDKIQLIIAQAKSKIRMRKQNLVEQQTDAIETSNDTQRNLLVRKEDLARLNFASYD
jgi:hypothetical protein